MVLERVMSSNDFRAAVIHYLNDIVVGEQKDEISRKLLSLTKKWKTVLSAPNVETFKSTCKTIETDPKFKLPWTVHEINDAIQVFSKLSTKALDGK